MTQVTAKERIILDIIVENRKANERLKETFESVAKFQKLSRFSGEKGPDVKFHEFNEILKNMKSNLRETNYNANLIQRSLLRVGASLVIVGHGIKNTFDTIKKESFNTFNKLTVNTELANNATNRLNMSMDYLKFTVADAINSAIEPMLPLLTDIIGKIVDWVEQNIELAGNIIIWGSIIGGVLVVVGKLAFAITGIVAAIMLYKSINTLVLFDGLTKGAAGAIGVATTSSTVMGSGVAGLITAIELLGDLVQVGLSLGLVIGGWKLLENGLDNDSLVQKISGAVLAVGGAVGLGLATGKLLSDLGAAGFSGPLALAFSIVAGLGVLFKFMGWDVMSNDPDKNPFHIDRWLPKLSLDGYETPYSRRAKTPIHKNRMPLPDEGYYWDIAIDGSWRQVLNGHVKNAGVIITQSTDSINTSIKNIDTNVSNMGDTVEGIKGLVKTKELLNEDINENAKKSKENLSILADDEFKNITSTTKNELSGLGSAITSLRRQIERDTNIMSYNRDMNRLFDKLVG